MKTTELIKSLQQIVEYYGDKDLRFTVKDSFSKFGSEANMDFIFEKNGDKITDYGGYTITENQLSIKISIKNENGKKPKITFR